MALPDGMTVKTLEGTLSLNKELSDSQDGVLSLQGVPYPIRQIAKYARLKLTVRMEPVDAGQPAEGDTPLQITMTTSLSGLGFLGEAPLKAVGLSTTKTDVHKLDGSDFTQEEPVVGKFGGRMWMSTLQQLEDEVDLEEMVKKGWDINGEGTAFVIRMTVRSMKGASEADGWTGEHVWGFQRSGEGDMEAVRYTGFITIAKGDKSATAKVVYDYAD